MPFDYIDNKALQATIVAFQEAKKQGRTSEVKQLEEQLVHYFYILAGNIITGFKFKSLDYDDALQECVFIALQKSERFDATFVGKSGQKAKAFNYMTTCIVNHLKQMFRHDARFHENRRRYYEHLVQRKAATPTKYPSPDVQSD